MIEFSGRGAGFATAERPFHSRIAYAAVDRVLSEPVIDVVFSRNPAAST